MSNAFEFSFWRLLVRAFRAPFATICAPAKTATQSSDAVGAAASYSFDGDEAKRMGDMLIRLGEAIENPNFKGFREDSSEDVYFGAIMNSAHAIWSREDALQLRHDFKNQTARIIAANRAHNGKEQIAVARELNKIINDLADILIAQTH